MTTLAALGTAVDARVPDPASRITSTTRDSLIEDAIRLYSADRPRQADVTLTGDGTTQFWATPSDWMHGLSRVSAYEWPIDEVPPSMYEAGDIDDVLLVTRRGSADWYTPVNRLGDDESARVHYVTTHSAATLPDVDVGAVADLAASLVAEAIAAVLAESIDGTISADAVQHQQRASDYIRLSEALARQYQRHMQGTAEIRGAILVLHDMDVASRIGGRARDLLYHPRRRR